MAVDLRQSVYADVSLLAVSGRLDAESAQAFEDGLQGSTGEISGPVVLDLSALDYISSAGLHSLMRLSRQAKAEGGTVVIARPTAFVAEVLHISRFDRVIDVYESVGQALAAVSSEAAAAHDENNRN